MAITAAQAIDGIIANPIVKKAIRETLNKTEGELTEVDLVKVTDLDLNFTEITNAVLKEVAKLQQLKRLYFNGAKITDVGLKEVAKLQNLEALSLTDTQITDAGLKDVAKLQQLTELYLHRTKITDAVVHELQKTLPRCKIFSKFTE